MTKWFKIILFFFAAILLAQTSHAQKQSDKLKQKEKVLQKKIATTKNLIKATRNTEQLTIAELGIINHQISYREELISTINYQMKQIDVLILDMQKQIEVLENSLKVLKEEYAEMIAFAYKNRNKDYALIYIFSAKTYAQAYRRMKYIQQYADFRINQAKRIKETRVQIEAKMEELALKKTEKLSLSEEQLAEKQNFLNDKAQQQQALNKLKANEAKLKTELAYQEKKKKEISYKIRKAIEEEIAATAKKNNSTGFSLTPEGKKLSNNFIANKGKLPWPVAKGEITGRYGKHQHAVVSTATIENNGIDITTTKESMVRCVFSGKVTSVLIIPGAGKVVMISHGAYRTVYANLKEVFVKKGDEISTKENIGVLLPSSDNPGVSQAHFEIWKISSSGMATENPALWIYR